MIIQHTVSKLILLFFAMYTAVATADVTADCWYLQIKQGGTPKESDALPYGTPALIKDSVLDKKLAASLVSLRTIGGWGPADPAPPFVIPAGHSFEIEIGPNSSHEARPGEVIIFGTHNRILHYPSLQHFEQNIAGRVLPLRLYDNAGVLLEHPEAVWDPLVHLIQEPGKKNLTMVMYGGVMTSPDGGQLDMAKHNIGRRIGAFAFTEGQWRFEGFVMDNPRFDSWLGHSYGHHIRQESDGSVVMHFEMVDEERIVLGRNVPWKTSLYQVKLDSAWKTKEKPVLIFDPANTTRQFAESRRFDELGNHVGYLAEGQRPFLDGEIYLNPFSVANFNDMSYGSGVLIGKKGKNGIEWQPLLKAGDLNVITRSLQQKFDINWCGRLAFYKTRTGDLRAMFHGIPNGQHVTEKWSNESTNRKIFDVPVTIVRAANGDIADIHLGK